MTTYLRAEATASSTDQSPDGVVVDDLVFVVGTAVDSTTGRLSTRADTVSAEVELCFDVIAAVLAQADCGLQDLIKITCWIADESFRTVLAETCRARAPRTLVTMTLIAGLPRGARVTIDAVARRRPAA